MPSKIDIGVIVLGGLVLLGLSRFMASQPIQPSQQEISRPAPQPSQQEISSPAPQPSLPTPVLPPPPSCDCSGISITLSRNTIYAREALDYTITGYCDPNALRIIASNQNTGETINIPGYLRGNFTLHSPGTWSVKAIDTSNTYRCQSTPVLVRVAEAPTPQPPPFEVTLPAPTLPYYPLPEPPSVISTPTLPYYPMPEPPPVIPTPIAPEPEPIITTPVLPYPPELIPREPVYTFPTHPIPSEPSEELVVTTQPYQPVPTPIYLEEPLPWELVIDTIAYTFPEPSPTEPVQPSTPTYSYIYPVYEEYIGDMVF